MTGANFIGDLHGESGLHEAGRLILKALQAAAIPVTYLRVDFGDARTADEPARVVVPPDVVHREINLLFYNINVVKALGPNELETLTRGKPTVGYWFWELPRVPEAYRLEASLVDEIWVPSRFVQQAFAASLDRPTVVVPQPACPNPDPSPSRGAFGLPEGRPVFLFTFSCLSNVARKNPFGVIDAFRAAFGRPAADGPLLVIKAHRPDAAPEAMAVLRARLEEVGGVLITEQYTRRQIDNLLACADAYVSLHRAEGYGLGMLESMALGKPVIATGYSGNVDFMSDLSSYLIPYTLRHITPDDHALQRGQRGVYDVGQIWAEPDLDAAAEALQQVYGDPDAARQRGVVAAHVAGQTLSPIAIGRLIRGRLERVDRRAIQDLAPPPAERLEFTFETPPPGVGWHDREIFPFEGRETYSRWTSSPQASFWTWLRPAHDYALAIVVRDAILPELLESLHVIANGEPVPMARAGRPPDLRITGMVARSMIGADGRLELRICVDRVVSPKDLARGEDLRKLGLAIGRIELVPAPA
jgi:glycosyltransferase involved in cell wall biosynthesis